MEVLKEESWVCECRFCRATLRVSSKDIKSDIGSEGAHAKNSIIKSDGFRIIDITNVVFVVERMTLPQTY